MSDVTLPPDGDEGFEKLYRQARTLYRLIQQGKRWMPDGKPAVAIADMDPAWRHNTAAFLVRNAQGYRLNHDFGEFIHMTVSGPDPDSPAAISLERDMHRMQAERAADPETWIKTTPLYKALVKGLPEGAERQALAAAARHWSDCPVRTSEHGACICAGRQAGV